MLLIIKILVTRITGLNVAGAEFGVFRPFCGHGYHSRFSVEFHADGKA
jgi:hypothetical protein